MMEKLAVEQLQAALGDPALAGWTPEAARREIRKQFRFADFVQALEFVNRVGALAEEQGHHPDITINYNRVTLSLTTHDAGGLTGKDLDLAARINRL